jgi:peptidoglycan-N-acetylmuramic acid deacetylase
MKKAMGKTILVILIVVALSLVGCGLFLVNRNAPANKDIDVIDEINEPQEKPDGGIKQEEGSQGNNQAADNDVKEETPEEDVPKQNPVENVEDEKPAEQKTEKLDSAYIDKLDNTKLSWWFTPNKEHKTPGIPSNAKELCQKYDGIYIGNTEGKVIYLTFDEGYENGYTPKILDTLKENEVKAIFFVTGPYIKKNPDLVRRMLDEGHQVGNHSINHPSLPTVDNITLEKELLWLEKNFQDSFGRGFKYMRPPMGEYSERTLAAAQQLGYKTVFWSFAYKDYDVNDQKGADYAYRKVMDNLHNGSVMLLHAVSKDNAEALDRIIKDIKAQGYEIRAFDL